jgi:hypothetical protein
MVEHDQKVVTSMVDSDGNKTRSRVSNAAKLVGRIK